MKNWTISTRVTIGFAAVILAATALGLFALLKLRRVETDANAIASHSIPNLQVIARITDLATLNRLLVYKHISSTDKADMRKLDEQFEAQGKSITEALDTLKAATEKEEGRRLLEALLAVRGEYRVKAEELLEKSRNATNPAEASRLYQAARTELDPIAAKYGATLDTMMQYEMRSASTASSEIRDAVQSAGWGVVIGLVVAIAVGFAVGFGIVRSTTRVLRTVSTSIDDASTQVASAAGQVAASSQSLAQGSSEQAASLEETSASLEEMASMTKRNSESANRAKAVSDRMRKAAETGAGDMEEMNRAMAAIKGSSDEISKIVKTIDEIAFQTNILALNAAVEAARAGEAGMGFAVVAEEVRNLAQRSAQSAKETAVKIEDSVSRSEHGVRVSRKVSDSLTEIVSSAREADALVAEIAQASKEQEQGIGQLNTAVADMDKVTQANASTAEETASASEEMSAQAAAQKEAIRDLLLLVGGAGSEKAAHSAGSDAHPFSAGSGLRKSVTPKKRTNGAGVNGNGIGRHDGEFSRATLPIRGNHAANEGTMSFRDV